MVLIGHKAAPLFTPNLAATLTEKIPLLYYYYEL